METTSTPQPETPVDPVVEAEKKVVAAAEAFVDAFTAYRRATAMAGEAANAMPDDSDVRRTELELHRAVANLRNARKVN